MTENLPDQTKQLAPKKSRLVATIKGAAPWAITAIIFVVLFKQVPFAEVKQSLGLMKPAFFIPVVVIAYVIFLIFDSLCYHIAFKRLVTKTVYSEVFLARAASFILGAVNFVAGQGGVGYWLAKKKNVPVAEAVSAVFFIMFMDFFCIVVISAISVGFFLPGVNLADIAGNSIESNVMRITFITLAALLFQIFVWIFKPKIPVVSTLLFKGPFSVFNKTDGRLFAEVFVVKMTGYILELVLWWVGLKSFGVNAGVMEVMTYLPIIMLIGAIPITVFGLGTSQAAWLYFFKGAAPDAVILAFTLAWNFFTIAIAMAIGLPSLYIAMKAPDAKE